MDIRWCLSTHFPEDIFISIKIQLNIMMFTKCYIKANEHKDLNTRTKLLSISMTWKHSPPWDEWSCELIHPTSNWLNSLLTAMKLKLLSLSITLSIYLPISPSIYLSIHHSLTHSITIHHSIYSSLTPLLTQSIYGWSPIFVLNAQHNTRSAKQASFQKLTR